MTWTSSWLPRRLAKNRWFCSGGYTPVQLVFGEMPRVPGELLSDNPSGLQPLCDAFNDPAGLDEAGAELRKSMAIRERARQLALAETSREAFKRAARTSSTPLRNWNPGQWVYCFRRGRPQDALHPVSRWVGPGIVVLQSPSVVYVAMRTRLWRCAPEQLRPAFPSEVLGRQLASDPELGELLRRVVSGQDVGAIDVTREGLPEERDQVAPVDQLPPGEQEPAEAPGGNESLDARPAPQQAPREVTPIAEGLLPIPEEQPVHQAPGLPPPRPPGLREPHLDGSRRSSIQDPAQPSQNIRGLRSRVAAPTPFERPAPPFRSCWRPFDEDAIESEVEIVFAHPPGHGPQHPGTKRTWISSLGAKSPEEEICSGTWWPVGATRSTSAR